VEDAGCLKVGSARSMEFTHTRIRGENSSTHREEEGISIHLIWFLRGNTLKEHRRKSLENLKKNKKEGKKERENR